MSRPAPDYCNNEDFLKWFDFDKNEFKEGAPQWLIDMVRKEDEERERQYQEALKDGYLL
jgi:hypothetical protein